MSDTERRLARLFADLWTFHRDGIGIDPEALEAVLLRSGMACVRPATPEEAERFECDPGDEVVTLTDEGRAIIDAAGRTP